MPFDNPNLLASRALAEPWKPKRTPVHGNSVALFAALALVGTLSGSCSEVFPGLFDTQLPSGTTWEIVPDNLNETADPFRMAVIGDSVAWGNGLKLKEKAWWIVAERIAYEKETRVIIQVYAYTQATIVAQEHSNGDRLDRDDCENRTGEAPICQASIMEQVKQIDDPDKQHLVLLTGCINDMGIEKLVDPDPAEEALDELDTDIRTACHDRMKMLLEELAGKTKAAHIIVSGYFPIFGTASFSPGEGLEAVNTLLSLNGFTPVMPVIDVLSIADDLIRRSQRFNDSSRKYQEQAVCETNDLLRDGNALLAGSNAFVSWSSPLFQPENVIFSDKSYLFGLDPTSRFTLLENLNVPLLEGFDSTIEFGLFPEDDLRTLRFPECAPLLNELTTDQEQISRISRQYLLCVWGSVAHPNPRGANAYADAIYDTWSSKSGLENCASGDDPG